MDIKILTIKKPLFLTERYIVALHQAAFLFEIYFKPLDDLKKPITRVSLCKQNNVTHSTVLYI